VRGNPNVASIAQRERLQALECVANEIGLAHLTAPLDDFIPQVDEDICHAVTKGRCLETPQQPIEGRRLGLPSRTIMVLRLDCQISARTTSSSATAAMPPFGQNVLPR
jgi:hypothetical protein